MIRLPEANSLNEGTIELVLATNELMRDYEKDRLVNQLDTVGVTTDYLDRYIALLDASQDTMSTPEDQAALTDALVLIRCFAALPLLSDERPGPKHVPEVLDFVQHAEVGWAPEDVDRVLALRDPAASEHFWRYVRESLVTGRLQFAHAAIDTILDTLPGHLAPLFDNLQTLLEKYPINFDSEYVWRDWRKDAINLHSQVLELPLEWRRRLEPVTEILKGQHDTIISSAPSWYAAIGGLYMFSDPSPDMLPVFFEEATAPGKHQVDITLDWEEGAARLFEGKVLRALVNLESLQVSAAVVIAEFCFQRGLLDRHAGDLAGQVREELALRFATVCLAVPPLISTAVGILGNMATPKAKQLAKDLLPQLVSRLPDAVGLAMSLAEQLQLPELASRLSQVAAERDLEDNNYVSAVASYFQAGDLSACRSTAWLMFEKVLLARRPVGDDASLEMLRSPPPETDLAPAVKDCLAPVAVLISILDKLEAGNQAIDTELRTLLSFPNPPLQFYPLLTALIIDLGTSRGLGTKTNVLLIVALDQWQDSAPKTVRDASSQLLESAQKSQVWQPLLDPGFGIDETVWMLRRRLALDVF